MFDNLANDPRIMQLLGNLNSGQPSYPNYIGMEPEALKLYGKQGMMLNQAPLNQFTQEAMRSGPSRAAQIAMQAQRGIALDAKAQARQAAAGEAATARTNLAMKGGAGAGSAERLAKNASNHALDMVQDANNTSAKNVASIALDDEKNRVGMLGQAPAMQLGASEYNSGLATGDINRQQLENTKLNAFNLDRYKSQMSAWAANKQADATANAGKK